MQQQELLGKIRMSPLMYGSLKYIARRGTIGIEDVLSLKQTQLRAFKKHQWIVETKKKDGVSITRDGEAALRNFNDNNAFFRTTPILSISTLLKLQLPQELGPVEKPVEKKQMVSDYRRNNGHKTVASATAA